MIKDIIEEDKEFRSLLREISNKVTINFDKIKEMEIHITSLLNENNFSNVEIEILISLMKVDLLSKFIFSSYSLLSNLKKE